MAIAFDRARDAVAKIRRHRDRCIVIHYASQSLYDDREGLSPRIGNIVVKDFQNDQTVSFANHLIAEKLHILKEDIAARLDEIEGALLQEFYDFVRNRSDGIWLHWNMVNIQFGFETLAHRYYVLTGKAAPSIDIDNRINIAGILQGLYGPDYVSIPHMPKLMELNGGTRKDFIPGAEEVALFAAGEFARLHASTVSKVRFFCDAVELVLDRKLKTQNANVYIRVERVMDSLMAKVIGVAAAIFTIVDLCIRALGH